MITMEVTTTLTKVHCGECGGVYAISQRYYKKKHEDGGYWNCPYCDCSWGFSEEASELEKARKEAQSQRDNVEWYRNRYAAEQSRHDQTKASLRSHKAAKTRLKNRIANGVCPCCKRHFENLHKHIQTKHPNYNKKDE